MPRELSDVSKKLLRYEQQDSEKRTPIGKGSEEEVFSGVRMFDHCTNPMGVQLEIPSLRGTPITFNRCEILKKILP